MVPLLSIEGGGEDISLALETVASRSEGSNDLESAFARLLEIPAPLPKDGGANVVIEVEPGEESWRNGCEKLNSD